jgi:hypothetical protein
MAAGCTLAKQRLRGLVIGCHRRGQFGQGYQKSRMPRLIAGCRPVVPGQSKSAWGGPIVIGCRRRLNLDPQWISFRSASTILRLGIVRNVELKGGQASALSQEEEVADVEFIRAQDGLPETASELRALARALKGDDQFIWLRYQATETQVKRLDLSRFRTIAFATHGVMAGQIRVAREAGLILTPPR